MCGDAVTPSWARVVRSAFAVAALDEVEVDVVEAVE
jgi:hypothetical protein